jgi:hypothetical protein
MENQHMPVDGQLIDSVREKAESALFGILNSRKTVNYQGYNIKVTIGKTKVEG